MNKENIFFGNLKGLFEDPWNNCVGVPTFGQMLPAIWLHWQTTKPLNVLKSKLRVVCVELILVEMPKFKLKCHDVRIQHTTGTPWIWLGHEF